MSDQEQQPAGNHLISIHLYRLEGGTDVRIESPMEGDRDALIAMLAKSASTIFDVMVKLGAGREDAMRLVDESASINRPIEQDIEAAKRLSAAAPTNEENTRE